MSEAERIAARLTEAQRRAVLFPLSKIARAGDLFPGEGKMAAQGWLRETCLFASYYHSGYLAYRLTPLGLVVRQVITNQDKAG